MYCGIQGGEGWGNSSKMSFKTLAPPTFLLSQVAVQVASTFKVTS